MIQMVSFKFVLDKSALGSKIEKENLKQRNSKKMEENLPKKLWILYSALNRYMKEYASYQKEEKILADKLEELKKAATIEDYATRHQVFLGKIPR